MEQLNRTYRQLHRVLGTNLWFTGAVVGTLVLVELLGRRSATTDLHDLLAVAILGVLAVIINQRHRETPIPWVRWLAERWQRLLLRGRAFAMDVGVDLRGQPALPRGTPPVLLAALIGVTVAVLVLLLFADEFPTGLRDLTTRVSYLLYLVLLVAMWAALLGMMVTSVLQAAALIHDALISQFAGRHEQRRRFEWWCLMGLFSTLMLAGLLLPPWLPLAICAAALTINLLTIPIPSNPNVYFVWRYRGSDGPVRAIPWGRWTILAFTLKVLSLLALILLARGAAVLGQAAESWETMLITSLLGIGLAWFGSGALLVIVAQMVIGRLRDPARAARPILHLAGSLPAGEWPILQRYFREQGWQVRRVERSARSTEVGVVIVDQEPAEREAGPSWPLQVTVQSLKLPETLQRLNRRHEIQMRRRLLAGLEGLFKRAARQRYRRGFGFIVAPHYWFFPGLIRDSQEEELNMEDGTLLSGIIGPPYHRVMPHAVRHHIYEVLRGVQIDLIFVEDGVGFRRFCKVLRLLFEVYDVYGGKRRADEIHLQGIPGIRVLIHQYQLDKPFESQLYPEPEYEDFGRARILHIFKDRGEQEEPLETPFDIDRVPVPGMAF